MGINRRSNHAPNRISSGSNSISISSSSMLSRARSVLSGIHVAKMWPLYIQVIVSI
jgi:hypothetical protein